MVVSLKQWTAAYTCLPTRSLKRSDSKFLISKRRRRLQRTRPFRLTRRNRCLSVRTTHHVRVRAPFEIHQKPKHKPRRQSKRRKPNRRQNRRRVRARRQSQLSHQRLKPRPRNRQSPTSLRPKLRNQGARNRLPPLRNQLPSN